MLIVRRYKPEDTPAIVALFRETIRRVNIRDYSLEQVRTWAPDVMDENVWCEKLRARYTIVAELAGEIVGFTNFEPNGHLDHFFVHADHQSIGVGRTLLAALEKAAREQGITRLFVEASITARGFFARQGYDHLAEQTIVHRGVEFVNHRMEKVLCK